ncbi:carbohydrate sulfotransferase 10-like [Homarus americanus]|uniref:carbohydrate sulfotransferase 10-like n=1 Tax=Homarus americanus TaxID=6706 RepID=UPI001C478A1D|nr:carbohydrate sulfotransferase 10-like [Homarus americanus]XP_042203922.1 carbohydrate sulfotransferase 10-like [Homarus americanus]
MRCVTERRSTRAAVTLLLVAALLYFTNLATHTSPASEPITVVMSASEVRAMIAAKTPQENGSPPSSSARPPNGSDHQKHKQDFVVINNKVIYKQPSVKSKSSGSVQWPVVMELTEAASLLELDLTQYQPEDREYLESRLGVMVERARQVKEACVAHSLFEPAPTHLVWDNKHTPSVAWCPNYKVASTTWMINFLKLAHFNDDNPAIPDLPPKEKELLKYSPKYGARHSVVNDVYPMPSTAAGKVEFLRKSLRVIIVRHPFTRILSAYRDKMIKEHPLPPKFGFRQLQKDIISKYRQPDSSETYPFPTFAEFVQYLIDFTAKFTSIKQWKKNVRCWTPFWVQCSVCTLDYNVIMKLETMADDERFLITLANFEELKKTAGEWRHLQNMSSTQAAPMYYTQLTRHQMLQLYDRYQHDFRLFDYTIDDYLSLAKDHQNPAKL